MNEEGDASFIGGIDDWGRGEAGCDDGGKGVEEVVVESNGGVGGDGADVDAVTALATSLAGDLTRLGYLASMISPDASTLVIGFCFGLLLGGRLRIVL